MTEIFAVLTVALLAKAHLLFPILIVGVIIWLLVKTETGKFIAALLMVGIIWLLAKCS